VALAAASILTVGLLLRALAHTVAAFGVAESISSAEALRTITLDSQWGSGWRPQLGAALLLLAAAISIQFHFSAGWALCGFGALAGVAALPLLGHAAGSWLRGVLHGAHVFGGGIWVGSLGCLIFAGAIRTQLFPKFAPIALTGAGLVAGSGALIGFQYLTSLSDIWTTTYGRVLAAKVAMVAGVAACGYFNWRQWREPAGPGRIPSSRAAELELALAVIVAVVTAFLTELEHPAG
jgi:putative copper resistance protein D